MPLILPGDDKFKEDFKLPAGIPHPKLLTENWDALVKGLSRPKNTACFVAELTQMAKAYGEINRHHSKRLPDAWFFRLQKRMSELRRILGFVNKRKIAQGKREVMPKRYLDYLFSGEENKKILREEWNRR